MKYLGYEIPLGLSATSHSVEQIKDFIAKGFTHFEIGIPAVLPGTERRRLEEPYSPEALAFFAANACRGCEEKLVALQAERVQAISDAKLRVWSVHLPFGPGWDVAHYIESERDAVVESLKRIIDLTAPWGARVYVLHGCLEPVIDAERPIRVARSIRSIRELSDHAAKYGARVALENLPRSCLANNSAEARAMLQAAGTSALIFDVNHLLGEPHDKFLDALAPYVVSTHLSDYDGVDERHWLPGKGIVPWKYIVTTLMEAGYRGPFLFELRAGENGPYDADEVLAAWNEAMAE